LRLARLLPLSTVVVMISSEAAYASVACAAEAALDAYLTKPHTEAALPERLLQAMERKAALRDIIQGVESGDLVDAAARCHRHCDERRPNWLNAARIGADLGLRLGDTHAAQQLFELILSAQLGYARSEYKAGAVQLARRPGKSEGALNARHVPRCRDDAPGPNGTTVRPGPRCRYA